MMGYVGKTVCHRNPQWLLKDNCAGPFCMNSSLPAKVWNMYAFWFRRFWKSAWNVFDFAARSKDWALAGVLSKLGSGHVQLGNGRTPGDLHFMWNMWKMYHGSLFSHAKVVVSIGLLNMTKVPLPGPLSLLRMMRAFRVFRKLAQQAGSSCF